MVGGCEGGSWEGVDYYLSLLGLLFHCHFRTRTVHRNHKSLMKGIPKLLKYLPLTSVYEYLHISFYLHLPLLLSPNAYSILLIEWEVDIQNCLIHYLSTITCISGCYSSFQEESKKFQQNFILHQIHITWCWQDKQWCIYKRWRLLLCY